VLLLLAAHTAGKHLLAIGSGDHGNQPPIVYLLAMIAFVCGSAGCALLVHGHHLFDKIQVSERWRRRPPAVSEMMPVIPPEEQAAKAEIAPQIAGSFGDPSGQMPVSERPRAFHIL
jgi:hypothetical protein